MIKLTGFEFKKARICKQYFFDCCLVESVYTVKLQVQHVSFRSTYRFFQIAYEGDFQSLGTVTI